MAAAPLYTKVIGQDSIQATVKSSLQCEKGTIVWNLIPSQKVFGCFSLCSFFNGRKRWHALSNNTRLFSKTRMKKADDDFTVNSKSVPFQSFTEVHSYKSGAMDNHEDKHFSDNEKQLKSLASYFSKLHGDTKEESTSSMPTSDFGTMPDSRTGLTSNLGWKMLSTDEVVQLKAKTGLGSLENYFDKLCELQTRETTSPSSTNDDSESSLMRRNVIDEAFYEETANKISTHDDLPLERMDSETVPAIFSEKSMQDSQTYDEASDFYLINLLASIDIAVFLFEIASPVRSSDVEQLSLPFIYGAKINQLILDGEWWRIVTPMFLHSGFLHISLGCWALLTFGPQVCRGYSPFTFFLIYVLGGISANMTSFIHTPGLTVCGTGPAFAVIGAWLIYQVQNKEAIAKEVSENMFWKAVLATALGFVISNFEHVDEWSHMGAVFSGLIYGFLTRPAALSDKTPSDNSQKEGITLLKHQADPCRSAAIFTLCICVLCSLVFVFEPGLETLVLPDLL